MPRTTSVRANALRQARAAKAARKAAQLAREQRIEATLADFFEAHDRAQQTRADAARRAEAITRNAELKASTDEQAARTALHVLRELLDSHAEVAQMCGLGLGTVRAMLTARDDAPTLAVDHAKAAGVHLGSPEVDTSRPEPQQANADVT